MATTYELIDKVVLGSDAASVTFSSIPGTGYTDLLLTGSARTARALTTDVLKLEFNGSTTGYSLRYLESDGVTISSGSLSEFWGLNTTGANATANTFGNSECYIPNYAGSTAKSSSMTGAMENNGTSSFIDIAASLWTGTSAITSIKIVSRVGSNIKAGSSFYLYGITKS